MGGPALWLHAVKAQKVLSRLGQADNICQPLLSTPVPWQPRCSDKWSEVYPGRYRPLPWWPAVTVDTSDVVTYMYSCVCRLILDFGDLQLHSFIHSFVHSLIQAPVLCQALRWVEGVQRRRPTDDIYCTLTAYKHQSSVLPVISSFNSQPTLRGRHYC